MQKQNMQKDVRADEKSASHNPLDTETVRNKIEGGQVKVTERQHKAKSKTQQTVKREKAEVKPVKAEKPKEPSKTAPSEDAILKAMASMEVNARQRV